MPELSSIRLDTETRKEKKDLDSQGEATCEKNMEIFLKCIETVATTTHTTGFAAIKITALGRPQLLVNPIFSSFVLIFYTCSSNSLR